MCLLKNKNNTKAQSDVMVKSMFKNIEIYRLQMLDILSFRIPIAIIAAFVFSYFLLITLKRPVHNNQDILFILIMLIALISLYCFTYKPIKKYKKYYRNQTVPILLKSLGGTYQAENKTVDMETLVNSNIVPKYDYKKSKEYLKSNIGDTELEFCELLLKKKQSKYNDDKIVFKGGAIILHFPFEFLTNIIITKNQSRLKNLNKKAFNPQDSITLNHESFNKIFQIYSNNKKETLKLFKPETTDMIIELYQLFKYSTGCLDFSCELKNNKALFLINYSKNVLEPSSIFQSEYNINKLKISKGEILAVINLINQLKSDYVETYKNSPNYNTIKTKEK